ncbi:MAG: hypothetical protein RPT25_11315 [Cycloclasticus sp.]|jgi:hypothetical protein
MCDICDGRYDESQIVDLIAYDAVPDDALICDEGWAELSRIWGTYGWGKKLISPSEWKEVCRHRGVVKFGN